MVWLSRCEELARLVERDPADVMEMWAERAAIREHEGGQSRESAERDAFAELELELAPVIVAGERRGPRSAPSHTAADAADATDLDARRR